MYQCPDKVCLGDIVADTRSLLRKTVRYGRSVLDYLIGIGNDFVSVLPDIAHRGGLIALIGNEIELLPPLRCRRLKTDQVSCHFRIQDHVVVIELVCQAINAIHSGVQSVNI